MIYDRCGDRITMLRYASEDDVFRCEGRKPDKTDRTQLDQLSYVVVEYQDTKKEAVFHITYLKADGGAQEIDAVMETWPRPFTKSDIDHTSSGLVIQLKRPSWQEWKDAKVVKCLKTTISVEVDGHPAPYAIRTSEARHQLRWPGVAK